MKDEMSEISQEVTKLQKELNDSRKLVASLSKRLQASETRGDELKIEVGELLGEIKEYHVMLDQVNEWNDEAWGRISKTQNVLVEMEKSRIESVRTGVPMGRLSWDVSKL